MTAEELLAELEPLTYAGRIRRMVELGRRAAQDPATEALLNTLEAGDFHSRLMALHSCFGSRDGARITRALADPSAALRTLAGKLLRLIEEDGQALAALKATRGKKRRSIVRYLRRMGRMGLIDALLDTLAADGDEDLGLLLPYGSERAVRRHLPALVESAPNYAWARLAQFHPEIAAEALAASANTSPHADNRLLWQSNNALKVLGDQAPEAALKVVRSLMRHFPLNRLDLSTLVVRRPDAVADLVIQSGDAPTLPFARLAWRLEPERLKALLRLRLPGNFPTENWFSRLSPTLRGELYAEFGTGWRDDHGRLQDWMVGRLPAGPREAEGRRHLALPFLATRPTERLPYAAYLPWEEARAVVEPSLRNPDAAQRSAALAALVRVTKYHRESLPDLLRLLMARKNEQDPVRCAMLTALADLPPGAWREEHLEDLGTILRQALDAADLSYATAAAAERRILTLLPHHPAWAAEWLATLVKERGQLGFGPLQSRLTETEVTRIAPALLPVLRSWENRERETHLVAFAAILGRRLQVFPGLPEILERRVRQSREEWISTTALGLLRKHLPERFRELVPALLEKDGTWATLPVIHQHLHRHRQDLLTPYLGRQAMRGRFSTGKTRWVLPIRDRFYRWTPTQRQLFTQTLLEVIQDEERDTPAVQEAVRRLAAMPDLPVEVLTPLAVADSRRPGVRDTTLRALGRLDAGQGIPALTEALDDDRARIAIYALRGALLEMVPEQALAFLRGVPLDKVTVGKEVVRLIGELRTEAAFAALVEFNDRDLHRDVRVALLRAFWEFLERDETWTVLEAAAVSPDPAIATGVIRVAADRLSPTAQRRLAGLMAMLLTHPDPTVRVAVLGRCTTLPIPDRERALLPRFLQALETGYPQERAAAASALFTTYAGAQAAEVGTAAGRLIRNRKALSVLCDALFNASRWNRRHLEPTVLAVINALEGDPLTAGYRVRLAAVALPAGPLAELLERMAAADELYADVLEAAAGALRRDATVTSEAPRLTELETRLSASPDARLRRLALTALLALAGRPRGWTAERRARLEVYRQDPAPLVAAAAQFTFPPEE